MPRLSKIGAAALAAFGWTGISSVTATYLVVAGGGGGGAFVGGGGGAGGYRTGTTSLNPTLSYTVTVGAGGNGGVYQTGQASNGSDSVFNAITSTGGGGGGNGATGTASYAYGLNGGSGGGAAYDGSTNIGLGNTPSTSPSQGSNGGQGVNGAGGGNFGGGGGGATGTGANGTTGTGGAGGIGSTSSISGTLTYYAGGGGGAADINGSAGSGGLGGGGNGGGARGASGTSTAGTANLGGGGGGSPINSTPGQNGGSGVVIISYTAPQKFSGGVVTLSGGNVIHTFNTSGTLGPITTLSASYLIVAGGGGGGTGLSNSTIGSGGGGGAGGMQTGSGLTIDPNSTYLVTVGAGGSGGVANTSSPTSGSNSSFSMVSTASVGGGLGGSYGGTNAATGGSGGGGNYGSPSGAAGTAGQGNTGGNAYTVGAYYGNGGGGGAGGVGGSAGASTLGNGGVGSTSSISGTLTYYAGGGGGGSGQTAGGASTGGTGGGGAGGYGTVAGVAGTANLGGGGGGGGNQGVGGTASSNGGNGGSGVVIISYPGSTQQMAGGTVTISGGNVIHTFTSTGYLAPIKYVSNSLRFRSSASAYLSRTPTTTSNRKTWTWSGWVKLGAIGQWEGIFNAGSSGNQFAMYLYTDNTLYIQDYTGSNNIYLQTTQVFRDPAAWYHIVFAVDTTQATSTNRFKLYVNGVEVTSFVSTTYPSQNYDTQVNSTSYQNNIGLNYQFGTSNAKYFDGYMTEINFVDGQALTPNSFGTFNSYGVWQPITYGGSYGTNGFYLPFKTNGLNYTGLFNGSSQYLTVANNVAFEFGTGSFTVELWFCTATKTNYQCLIGQYAGGATGWYIETDANGYAHFGTGGTVQCQGNINVCDGQWHHIAVVRNGSSSTTLYIDGKANATASITDSGAAPSQPLGISYLGGGFTRYVNGNISNVRIVKGTAVYTSNFTVPTSNLTNISGTSLLTLQGASIVDNSSNAFTITNNGGVTTPQNYPFSAANIFYDQGPAGNNWTPNNTSGISGTTLDYMTDVPTLTSATAANYAVLNPVGIQYGGSFAGTFTNANLSFATSGNASHGFGTMSVPSASSTGYYFEVVCTSMDTARTYIGMIDPWASPSVSSNGASYSWPYKAVLSNTGGYFNFASGTAGGSSGTYTSYAANDVVMVAYKNGVIWFGKNGTWMNSGNPAAGTGYIDNAIDTSKTWMPYIGYNSNFDVNFGQRPFSYTPPTGFVALNTYNM